MRNRASERGLALILSMMILMFLAALGAVVLWFNIGAIRTTERVDHKATVSCTTDMVLERVKAALMMTEENEHTSLNSIVVENVASCQSPGGQLHIQDCDAFGAFDATLTPLGRDDGAGTIIAGGSIDQIVFAPVNDEDGSLEIEWDELCAQRDHVIGVDIREILAPLYGDNVQGPYTNLDRAIPGLRGLVNIFHDAVNVQTTVDANQDLVINSLDYVSPRVEPNGDDSLGGVATVDVHVVLLRNNDPNQVMGRKAVRIVISKQRQMSESTTQAIVAGAGMSGNAISGNTAVYGGITCYSDGLNPTDYAIVSTGNFALYNAYTNDKTGGHPIVEEIWDVDGPCRIPDPPLKDYKIDGTTYSVESLGAGLRVKTGIVDMGDSNSTEIGLMNDLDGDEYYDGGMESLRDIDEDGELEKTSLDLVEIQHDVTAVQVEKRERNLVADIQESAIDKEINLTSKDENGDGIIDASEEESVHVGYGYDNLDTNGDGQIDGNDDGGTRTSLWSGGEEDTFPDINDPVKLGASDKAKVSGAEENVDGADGTDVWVDGGIDNTGDGVPDVTEYDVDGDGTDEDFSSDTARELYLKYALKAAVMPSDVEDHDGDDSTVTFGAFEKNLTTKKLYSSWSWGMKADGTIMTDPDVIAGYDFTQGGGAIVQTTENDGAKSGLGKTSVTFYGNVVMDPSLSLSLAKEIYYKTADSNDDDKNEGAGLYLSGDVTMDFDFLTDTGPKTVIEDGKEVVIDAPLPFIPGPDDDPGDSNVLSLTTEGNMTFDGSSNACTGYFYADMQVEFKQTWQIAGKVFSNFFECTQVPTIVGVPGVENYVSAGTIRERRGSSLSMNTNAYCPIGVSRQAAF